MGSQGFFGVIFVLAMALFMVQLVAASNTTEATNKTVETETVKSNVTEAPVVVTNATHAATEAHNGTTAATPVETTKAGAETVFSSMVIVSYALCLTFAANM